MTITPELQNALQSGGKQTLSELERITRANENFPSGAVSAGGIDCGETWLVGDKEIAGLRDIRNGAK